MLLKAPGAWPEGDCHILLPHQFDRATQAVFTQAARSDYCQSSMACAPGVAVGLQGISDWDAAQRTFRECDRAVVESVL